MVLSSAFGLESSLGLRSQELPKPYAGIFLYSTPLVKVPTQYSVQYEIYSLHMTAYISQLTVYFFSQLTVYPTAPVPSR